ncbi:MAG: lamin tail domain-containing protein, partial [Verrucomicrobiota bacterium]
MTNRKQLFCFLLALFIPLHLHAQDLIISEFMAVNNSGLLDEDGDSSDWIELHNVSPGPIDLTGWRLTDDAADPFKWVFPNLTINADQRLVVFASNKDRTNPAMELHTNFRLTGNGEYLGLIRPDSSIAYEFAPSFPEQLPDVSYGVGLVATNQDTFVDNGTLLTAHIPA